MKRNGNNQTTAEYYLGLDIGTDSVGFAATDTDYRLLRRGGNSIWGIRLFDEGQTAEERRLQRVNRRRLARRKWRLHLLRELFDEAVTQKDPGFFSRMDESFLYAEDKTGGTKFSLFADSDYTDKDHARAFPTAYHLRHELIVNPSAHDVRLVYLALHHIIKSRGHFLFEVDSAEERSPADLWTDFLLAMQEQMSISVYCEDTEALFAVLSDRGLGKIDKSRRIEKLLSFTEDGEREEKELKKIAKKTCALLAGGKLKMSDLFADEAYAEYSFSVEMGEEEKEKACEAVGDLGDVLRAAAAIYNMLLLNSITKEHRYICDFKVAEYLKHKADVRALKDYLRHVLGDKELYKSIFNLKKAGHNNYAAYSGYKKADKEHKCSAEEFCKFLKSKLGTAPLVDDARYREMFERIEEGTFAPKLRTSANGVFPNSLHEKELVAILENAKAYLPFLSAKDESGLTVAEKILSVFRFRIPYYVGPLNPQSKHGWITRDTASVVYPWSFSTVVDEEASAGGFIEKMTSLCTYTGDNVLPRDSLLYSKYAVLNEINNIKINGKSISVETKQKLYRELFEQSDRKVTKKRIEEFLRRNGMSADDVVSGIDDTLNASLASYHKMKRLIPTLGTELAEEVIRHIVLFGDSKKLLRSWLKTNTPLDEEQIGYTLKLRFKEWGRLSQTLLTGLCALKNSETGEAQSVMELLWDTNENLMQILYKYGFIEAARGYRKEKHGIKEDLRSAVADLYVSPKIRRSIWQTLRIIDEIVDARRAAPQKVFIEVAREEGEKGKRTDVRKQQLMTLYKKCRMEADALYAQLDAEDPDRLRGDKYFLYYSQFGKCMYSGEPIDLSDLSDQNLWDIDHIYPRSRIKDDSLDNRVLVKATLNRNKTNVYPIAFDVRSKMSGWWKTLYERGAITKKKYERLTRGEELSVEELTDFVNRQLVETRQSTKAVAELLETFLPQTRVVYSKAGHVSDFRKEFGFRKCRSVNDLHHAKDAYLNIVVGNYFDTRFTDSFRRNIRNENYSVNPQVMYKHDVPGAWMAGDEGTIATVKTAMAKNSVLYTRQPRTVGGALYDLQPVKAPRGQVPLKKMLSIDKYGGYNSAKGAYFVLVEYTEKKKRARFLENVLLHERAAYEADPQAFAKAHWAPDAQVIIPRILVESLMEIDGQRMHVRGRTGERIVFVHAYQLTVDQDTQTSFARIEKYLNRCKEARGELPLYPINGITAEENLRLYRFLKDKSLARVYGNGVSTFTKLLDQREEAFSCLSLHAQCKVLAEMLKFFRCNAEYPNMELLDGPGKMGITLFNKKISDRKSMFLIHQSVTGLYEIEIDLLTCSSMELEE